MKVIIAGAGPAGLTAALVLARAGIPVTVFERNGGLAEDLRASTWHPPTLDMMGSLGLIDDILRAGLIARYTQHRDRKSGQIAEFDMALLRGETDHPYRVQYEQFKYTRLVHRHLRAFPHAQIVFNANVTGVTQTADTASLGVTRANGTQTHHADYIIGADGARGAVRHAVGIDFEGLTFPERFFVATTTFDFSEVIERLCFVNYFADIDEWLVLLRVLGAWRCLFPTWPGEADEQILSDERTEQRLQAVWPRAERYETIHRTLYSVHQRVAARYRVGRVLLAGDAAHLNNPLGGMGMNGGLHDAINLAEKLIAIERREAGESILDRYERQRRPVAIDFINANTARNRRLMTERDPTERKKAQDDLCHQAENPLTAKAFLMKSSMIEALRAAARID
ncbi:MAG: FAD-binding protein [Betaproteobacteria bacterium]|nr:FAD-binding protein [Betaproteobacteria bacterium]